MTKIAIYYITILLLKECIIMRSIFIIICSVLFFVNISNAKTRQVPSSQTEIMFSYSPLVKKASHAVVNIYTKKKVRYNTGFSPFLNDPFFQQFFGNNNRRTRERVESSLGSGVIIDEKGLIITNHHVIKGSDEINIVLSDRREFKAKIVKVDEKSDVALLKVELGDSKEKFSYLQISDSDDVEVGDIVLAIGNPFGVGQTVTNGIVSASARSNSALFEGKVFIQTDAAINPGNSGGALIDMQGNLIGLNSAIYSKSGGSNGIGFAIPSNLLKRIIKVHKANLLALLGLELQCSRLIRK